MKGFPRRGSDFPGKCRIGGNNIIASMKGFPRRGSDACVLTWMLTGPRSLNEGLPQKGKRSPASCLPGEGFTASMKGFPRRGSDPVQPYPALAVRLPQ